MILIVKRPVLSAGGWGYLGEEAGDECEPPAPARSGEGGASPADTIPVFPAIPDVTAPASAHVDAPWSLTQGRAT
jgi:hypothetical protein